MRIIVPANSAIISLASSGTFGRRVMLPPPECVTHDTAAVNVRTPDRTGQPLHDDNVDTVYRSWPPRKMIVVVILPP
jgi:hypothetical protein